MVFHFMLLFSISFIVIQNCICYPMNNFDEVIDITNGTRDKDLIIYNNINFTSNNYFYFNGKTYGRICNIKVCLPKCCSEGKRWVNNTCQNHGSIPRIPIHRGSNTSDMDGNDFYLMKTVLKCVGEETVLPEVIERYIQENGHLHSPDINFTDKTSYCIEGTDDSNVVVIVCPPKLSSQDMANSLGMIISMPFLLATFLVYALLPDRNLPAKALMCYVLSLLFAYILLVTIQLNNLLDSASCKTLAFFCYFFFMASFFWMNASCLDIFFTFSGIRGLLGEKKKENRRFMYYSAYAWGVPVLMVGFAAIFTFEKTDNLTWATGIGEGQCWFRNGWPTGIYFYFPIATLLIVNIVLFSITTYKIKRVQRDTKMLKNVDSRKNRKYDNNDKQRFNLYVKLLFAMGINWSMEVISWAIMWRWSNVPEYVWVLTDFCNAVYGVFIFFIFVFKRNIWMMLKKRYLQFTGRPQQAHTLTSVNRTTVSQVSSSEA